MKILVLNGSPKKERSDTLHITRAFLEGMTAKDRHEIQTIDVIDQHIEFCSGCLACMRNGGICRHDDDMRAILEQILASMAMQQVGGRYAHVGQADYSHLRYRMICGCGFPNSRHNFEPAAEQFRLMFPSGHTIITVPESPMFNAPEAASVTVPRLALVREAGRQYSRTGTIEAGLLAQIGSPMIPEEVYAGIVNGQV